MSDRIETIRAFTLLALDRLNDTVGSLSEEDLDWKACEGANSLRWILTHTAQLGKRLHLEDPRGRLGLVAGRLASELRRQSLLLLGGDQGGSREGARRVHGGPG